MIINVAREEDMPGVLAQLRVIEALRGCSGRQLTRIPESPWIRTARVNERYL